MNTNEKKEILEKREYLVVKHNDIVQKSRYELSVTEQRSIAYICSMIKPRSQLEKEKNVPFILEYEFNIREYARVCGIECDNGRIYEETKALLKGLQQKVMWLPLEDGKETTVNWVNKAWTNKRSGKARIRLDEDMAPYLFDLGERFLSYGLKNILAMKSQYSIRLYEILKSYEYLPTKTKVFDVEELKRLLMVENVKSYNKDFSLFRIEGIEKAQSESNEVTDIFISIEPMLKGNKTVKVKFTIKPKNSKEESICHSRIDEKLGEIE